MVAYTMLKNSFSFKKLGVLNNKVYICSIFYKISIFFIEIIITRLVHPAPTSFGIYIIEL